MTDSFFVFAIIAFQSLKYTMAIHPGFLSFCWEIWYYSDGPVFIVLVFLYDISNTLSFFSFSVYKITLHG